MNMLKDKSDLLRNYPAKAPFLYCPETGLALEPKQTAFTYAHWYSDACDWRYHPMTGLKLTLDKESTNEQK